MADCEPVVAAVHRRRAQPSMIFQALFRPSDDPVRRAADVAKLGPDSDELAAVLASDPAPEVRVAAAGRCASVNAVARAFEQEPDPTARAAMATALVDLVAQTTDAAAAAQWLASERCTDAMRGDVARRASDAERRRTAIAAIADEPVLVGLALDAGHADTRMAAAEHVRSIDALRAIAEGARDKDRGLARHARKELEAIQSREREAAEADAVLAQLEGLASEPGPILTRVIELNRRWEALTVDDVGRLARCESARRALQDRFAQEHAEQRARADLEHRIEAWLATAESPASSDELIARRETLGALHAEAQAMALAALEPRLAQAGQRVEQWAREVEARAAAEAIVIEAEQLAASTSVDDAKLPERWRELDAAMRAPPLAERFDAALAVITQRRQAQARAAEQVTHSARQQVHSLLIVAEQALAAGEMQRARAAFEEIRTHRAEAGSLPKPTTQRLGRLQQELREIEQWKSFAQHQVYIQLCERAEAAAHLKTDAPHIAAEVQKLRNEWKALEQQHGEVPRSLRERFERGCEKAYAPAKRYFAEQAQRRKEARQKREDFIAGAAAHAQTLLTPAPDWRAIDRWLRETEQRWRDNDLGSVDPKAWKAVDAEFDAALAGLRSALGGARNEAKARRAALIAEATALAPKAMDRDTPSRVKELQARWQAEAKAMTLTQRDERTLWEQFRAACDAIFETRNAKRKEQDDHKRAARGALETICVQLEQLARGNDQDEQQLRRAAQELQDQWTRATRRPDPALRSLESRYAAAKKAIDAALAARARARKSAVWQALAAKEHLCEELDRAVLSENPAPGAETVQARWDELPPLVPAWEKALAARRDATLRAFADDASRSARRSRIEADAAARRDMLLELELTLGLESPAELQAQRRTLQLKQLQDRFKGGSSATAATPAEKLVAWCAMPGVADTRERQRFERILGAVETAR